MISSPSFPSIGIVLARIERPGIGPCVVTVRDGDVVDITSREAPTMRDICERADPAAAVAAASGDRVGSVDEVAANSPEDTRDRSKPWFLAPCDLQVIKACGVTFARSMVERVIEERAAGDPALAADIRGRIGTRIGETLRDIVPGSARAASVKQALIEEDLWSQYLEVGIGPDAEVFTKAPVLSAVGTGAHVGIHPASRWNNPEPEVVLCVNSRGQTVGAALGNDVNLRDIEGRSALLLGKAKDNNASTAIGPAIRLFDDNFTIDDVRAMTIALTVKGVDGFVLEGSSDMGQISRDPLDLAAQTLSDTHAYPDGVMLFCGTMFAPTKDRDAPGSGFTHHLGDTVSISAQELGTLTNEVHHCADCERWEFSASHLMRNLAARGLLVD
jgi:fumarylacetoacetate (FAA) hydrolase family protein